MKNAYIFKPSICWEHCGGGLVIVADSFEEAQKLFGENGKLFFSEKEAEQDDKTYNIWTLVESIQTTFPESKIILYDENWA